MAQKPNILFFLVDQMRMPPSQPDLPASLVALNQVLSFDPACPDDNPFLKFFPAFRRLRRNAVRLAHHHIAAAACVPSRAALFTGQYPSRTGVTQTAGMFKNDYDPGFPWLPNNQVPTVGDWFRAAGYTTHFFGRHDFTTPPTPSLDEWGFSDWSTSWPSSQGGGPSNLGVFRDIGFVDVTNTFLNRMALGTETNIRNIYNSTNATTAQKPWFAVSSYVNPHDITGWPLPWYPGIQTPSMLAAASHDAVFQQIGAALSAPGQIPAQHQLGKPPAGGTYQVDLNPDGFPQDNAALAASWDSDLATKPTCQLDASFKVSQGFLAQWPKQLQPFAPLPYKLAPRAKEWYLAHLQFYIYLQYLVNLEIDKVLANMERNGLLANTIVVFTADHGEMGGAHGGQIEKWHNAYRETVHVPFIVSSPLINPDEKQIRDLDLVTSHIDLVPTLLGLAGYHKEEQAQLQPLIQGHQVYELVGNDLSLAIAGKGDADGAAELGGALFVTDDEITQPTDRTSLPAQYVTFLEIVRASIEKGRQPAIPGPITQPNHVRAYCEQAWKLARYVDPNAVELDQWELYHLAGDPGEDINLVSWSHGEPVVMPDRIPRGWDMTAETVKAQLDRLRQALDSSLLRAGYTITPPANAATAAAPAPASHAERLLAQHDYNSP
jgi:arylsulfatase A-like enzyme